MSAPAFIPSSSLTAPPSGDQRQSAPAPGLGHVLLVVGGGGGSVLQRGCQLPNWEFGTQRPPVTRHRHSARRRGGKPRKRRSDGCLLTAGEEEEEEEQWLDSDQLHAGSGRRRKGVCLQRDTRNRGKQRKTRAKVRRRAEQEAAASDSCQRCRRQKAVSSFYFCCRPVWGAHGTKTDGIRTLHQAANFHPSKNLCWQAGCQGDQCSRNTLKSPSGLS